jgi:hypothetical protein
MEPHTIYTHSIESLRFAFQAIGYDNCMKELAVIKHIHNVTQNSITKETQTLTVQQPITDSAPQIIENTSNHHMEDITGTALPQIIEDTDLNKNIIIQPIKYSRAVPPDSNRCVTILDGNIRCSFKRSTGSERCSRHNK